MPTPTLFQALTAAMGEALALYGGARQTRLTAAIGPGDTSIPCERTAGLPEPGQVSIGRVTYRYTRIVGGALTGITALVAGTKQAGVVASHPPGAAVLDTSGTYSELDTLRGGLFLGTAEGSDLADLGRSLGVLRSSGLNSDDQYRSVVKALAYARRGTVGALGQLMDALVGPGNYELVEDPFDKPGQVQVVVGPEAEKDRPTLGRTYATSQDPVRPASGSFTQALPAFGHGSLMVSDLALRQGFRTARPSEADPAGLWAWTGANEASDVRLVSDPARPGSLVSLVGIKGAYKSAPPALQRRCRAELNLWGSVINPPSLASDARCLGGQLHDGEALARWGGRATASGWQLALVNQQGVALSGWVDGPVGFAFISIALSPKGAALRIGGRVVATLERSALPAPAASDAPAAFGNFLGSGQSATAEYRLRSLMLDARPGEDLWLGRGTGAVCLAADRVGLPGAALASRHVGHALWLDGPPALARARGQFEIAAVFGKDQATVRGQARTDGQLADGNPTPYFVAPANQAFTWPDDLGKAVVVTSGGSTVEGRYTISSLYDAETGVDLRDTRTPGVKIPAYRARLDGGRVVSAAGLQWRLDPVFAGQSGLTWLLEDAGTVVDTADGQKATPWKSLPTADADYAFPRRRVLGGVVRRATSTSNRVADEGPPVLLAVNAFYATDRLESLEAYLPAASGSGVQVVVTPRG